MKHGLKVWGLCEIVAKLHVSTFGGRTTVWVEVTLVTVSECTCFCIWRVYSDNRLYMWVVKTSMWVENCFYLLLCSFVVLFMRCALLTSYGSVRVILILLTSMLILASLRPFYCLSVRYKVGCILTKHEFNWDVLYLVSAAHLFWQICRRWNEVLICIKSTIQRNWYLLSWHE